jgi:hypothetical protein
MRRVRSFRAWGIDARAGQRESETSRPNQDVTNSRRWRCVGCWRWSAAS